MATEQIVLGTIEISMSPNLRWYFGHLTGVGLTGPEGLNVYYAPSSLGDKRKVFASLGLTGPGSLTLRGKLASNLPGEQCYTYRLGNLVEAMITRCIYATVTVTFDFSFGFTGVDLYAFKLYDVLVGTVDMNAEASSMGGTLVLHYSRAEEA